MVRCCLALLAIAACTPAPPPPHAPPPVAVISATAPPLSSAAESAELPEIAPPAIDKEAFAARVEASAANGGLELSDAWITISAARDPLSQACHRHANVLAKLSVGLSVEPTGKVSRAQLLDGSADDPLPACVLGLLRQLSFAVRDRASSVVVTVTWVPAGELGRQLEQDEVMKVVMAHRSEIRKVCEPHVPIGGGRVLVRFSIAPNGKIAVAQADSSIAALGECVRAQVASWTFPLADAPTEVDLPFVFSK